MYIWLDIPEGVFKRGEWSQIRATASLHPKIHDHFYALLCFVAFWYNSISKYDCPNGNEANQTYMHENNTWICRIVYIMEESHMTHW